MEPYCAEVRPLLLHTVDEVAPVPHVPFSTDPASPFFAQAWSTYQQSLDNDDESRDSARVWTDNPVFSGLPAGHWLHIVIQVAEQHRLRLDLTVKALVRTAVALHDAFMNCWTWKYRYNLLRPVTYVRTYGIAAGWNTWVNTPQFPEYTSGHSVASAAAARVLTDLFGPKRFDDRTLATTQGIVRSTRQFRSFEEAAAMAAQSRLYGGIHYPMGIAAGLEQGEEIGRIVVSRLRTRHA
jgi:membrane-associated phospholipid phosphatase